MRSDPAFLTALTARLTARLAAHLAAALRGAARAGLVALAALAALAAAAPARAQTLMVAPHAVVVTEKARTGALTLVNPSDKPVEVSLSTSYGYPVTDSAGNMSLRTVEATDDTMPSAARWVRFFPERLVVPPLGRRTVRILVTPPAGLAPGEYWSRIVVAGRGGTMGVGDGGTPGIAIGLSLEVRSVLALFYRHGAVATGVRLDSVQVAREGDSVVVRARMQREGTAAYVGSLRATVRDDHDVVRAAAALPVGVYYALTPRLAFPARALPSGAYTVAIEATTDRPDVPAAAIVKAPPRRTTLTVAVP